MVYILCIYDGIRQEWTMEELSRSLSWLKCLTKAETCEDALSIAWMRRLKPDEKRKLGLLRDLYLGQFDGKVHPRLNMEQLYKEV